MRKKGLTVFVMIMLLAAGIVCVYLYLNTPNTQVVPAFEEGDTHLVMEGEYIREYSPLLEGDKVLLSFQTVQKYLDPHIWWDEQAQTLTVTTPDKVIRMKLGDSQASVNNKPVNMGTTVVTRVQNQIYIPIDFLKELYRIRITVLKDNNVVMIDSEDLIIQEANPVNPKAAIRKGRSIRYPILRKLDAEDAGQNTMIVFAEYDKWYKVRTIAGEIGYVEKRYVVCEAPRKPKTVMAPAKPVWRAPKGKINLVWEMTYSNKKDVDKTPPIPALDVISPTWFHVPNEAGDVVSRCDPAYVEWAHKNGYKVWALVSSDSKRPDITHGFLHSTQVRDKIIQSLIDAALLYKLDGINIDFENIYKDDKAALTQFVREAAPLMRDNNLTITMDVSVPDGSDNWSLCYDRKAIGEAVDYVMLMTYDQHYASSPVAGSVAQLVWVEENVKKVLQEVPADKLLLGLPFYTRVWKEVADSDGKSKVANTALSMDPVRKLVKENNAQVTWDEESGQFYTEYIEDNIPVKIWIEDENSIHLKASLVHKYQLAGTAAWKKGNESAEVWNVLSRTLKDITSYTQWKEENKDFKPVYNTMDTAK